MGIWLKDVEDYSDAEAATRSGLWGALGYVAWVAFSVGVTFATTDAAFLFQWLTPMGQAVFIAVLAAQVGVALFAAWRFKLGKGAIAGSLAALVLVAEVGFNLANGIFLGIIWYVALLAILLALINGVRGALAVRAMHHPQEAGDVFE